MPSKPLATFLAWGFASLLAVAARGAEVRVDVAAAADLKFAMDDIVLAFAKSRPDVAVVVTYGSSGNFFSQISNGAPFDMFFSADTDYPKRLQEAGLALEGSEFAYAVGRIVLWVPRGSPLQIERGFEVLRAPEVRHVAIANPRHAPYGRAAESALRSLGVYEAVKEKLVFGENVAQTAQFAQTGAADAGIIALALALAPALSSEGRYWEVPLDAYPRMEQGGIILRRTKNAAPAYSFREFVVGDKGRAILTRYGFSLPGR